MEDMKPGDDCPFCEEGKLEKGMSKQWVVDTDNPGENIIVELSAMVCSCCKSPFFQHDDDRIDILLESGFSTKGKEPARFIEVPVYVLGE